MLIFCIFVRVNRPKIEADKEKNKTAAAKENKRIEIYSFLRRRVKASRFEIIFVKLRMKSYRRTTNENLAKRTKNYEIIIRFIIIIAPYQECYL